MTLETKTGAAIPTPEQVTEQALREAEERVARLASSGLEEIEHRLEELERELQTERAVEASAVVVMTGPAAGDAPAVCCPPGTRTAVELFEERCVLKALRGDFRDVPPLATAEERDEVARFEGEGGRAIDGEEDDPLDQRNRAAIAEALQAARR